MADKAGRPKSGRDDTTVKIDSKLIQKARVLAAHERTTLNKLLSEMLEGPIESRTARMLREMTEASQPAADAAPARPSRRKPKAP